MWLFSGSYAFVVGGGYSGYRWSQLWVIDIANPTAPHLVNQVSISSINAIEIVGEYAFLVGQWPENPGYF